MKGRTVILIQARSASTRLPGKIFKNLPEEKGGALLSHIYRRMSAIAEADAVRIVIPETDAELKKWCRENSFDYFSGSENDVRERYRKAAVELKAIWVVRATGDNPCVDPVIAAQSIQEAWREGCDLFSFRNLPLGCAVEVMSASALLDDHFSPSDSDLEHVSLHIKHHPDYFRIIHKDHSSMSGFSSSPRLTVDTAEDLAVVRNVFGHLGADFSVREIMDLYGAKPELFEDNRRIEQRIFPGKES